MISQDTEQLFLHLSLIDAIGPGVVRRILSRLQQEGLLQLYGMSVADIMHQCELPTATAQRLYDGLQDTVALKREQELLAKHHDIAWYSVVHPKFPTQLKEIHLPPIGIFVRGRVPQAAALAVVGARKANMYGQHAIDRIIPPLCQQGTVIVSGGARGIDTMAHKAAVASHTPTIAVLGAGLLRPYPYENKELFDEIVQQGGALVSAFPLTMEALPGNFPARNRIIAGLSYGTLVVQAAKKSGALITASFAVEQGRDVFAVPGPVNDPLSVGCHDLLRQGATLVATHEDITEHLPIFTCQPAQLTIDDTVGDSSSSICSTQLPRLKEEETVRPDRSSEGMKLKGTNTSNPDSFDGKLILLCAKPISVDDLSGKLSMEMRDVQARLFVLQMTGRVQQNFMGLWHI